MDKKKALQELLRYVEEGGCGLDILKMADTAFTSEGAHNQFSFHKILPSVHGSLDAAKALHDAVLPGWHVDQMGERDGGWRVVLGRHDGSVKRNYPDGIVKDNPARAWLIAILNALISEQENQ